MIFLADEPVSSILSYFSLSFNTFLVSFIALLTGNLDVGAGNNGAACPGYSSVYFGD
jgi:hypothetical protein